MNININLTEEQQKALLTEYASIGEYVNRIVVNRANRLCLDVIFKGVNHGYYNNRGDRNYSGYPL